MVEIRKDIKGHKGLYQISNLGRVRPLDRKVYQWGRMQLYEKSLGAKRVQVSSGVFMGRQGRLWL